MLRSILIGLDGSTYSTAATELGLHWAQQYQAGLSGIAIVDRPSIVEHSAKAIVDAGEVYEDEIAEASQTAAEILEAFRRRCAGAGIAAEVLQECGPPVAEILLEAQRHDLVLLGKQTYFRFDRPEHEDDVAQKIIEHSPRPVVVSPGQAEGGTTTVIAYDSSLQAAKALGSFVASGMAHSRVLHLVGVDDRQEVAAQKLDRAVDFLNKHDLSAQSHAIESEKNVGEILLEQVAKLNAGLLVMGVFGKPSLQSFFFGSTTKHILKDATVPVFVYH